MELTVNNEIMILSSQTSLYKTEIFVKKTRKFFNADIFFSKICETITKNLSNFNLNSFYKIQTKDKVHTIFLCFGKNLKNLSEKDIVLYDYIDKQNTEQKNDLRLNAFSDRLEYKINIDEVLATKTLNFEKLYIISSNEERSTNIQSSFLEYELSRTADEDLILEFIKIIERTLNKNAAENIYETQNGNYVCGYSNNLLP